ncbi:MAG TPA: polysaccharide biosynthesis/export family protein [Lacibacter sp.]|nr:polysaccharide biosynthesis/export family protein [Lacibacter sp.]HMO89997.1 polysaccharide biosynthesis/export family protein [Lacibacter sp.]HMP87970.1 polysaccharide biosynthesis/export family protein [Lacibacter sp.]
MPLRSSTSDRFSPLSFLFVVILLLHSCVPARKAIFFNGLEPGKDSISLLAEEAAKRIYPGDRIAITIVMEHPDAALLNQGMGVQGLQNMAMMQAGGGFGYLVDKDGNVELVKLGLLHVAGKTPAEVAELVKTRVAVLYKDPQVYCTLSGRVLFLGSGSPTGGGVGGGGVGSFGGAVPIMNDRLTILEALSIRGFGDPTAVREKVWIIRERGEEREFGTIDINSKDIFKSPYYYLRNNDIVYMEPNRVNTFLTINAPLRNIFTTSLSTLAVFLSFWALLR